MLGAHNSDIYDELDIEELASVIEHTPQPRLYQKSGHVRDRQDSYSSSWSSDTITPSRKSRSSANFLIWLRWGIVVSLQTMIVFMLWWRQVITLETDTVLKNKVVETGGDINGLYKTCTFILLLVE